MRFSKIALLAAILLLGVASAASSKQITEAADGQDAGEGQQVLSSQTLAFQCSAMKEEEGWTYTPAYATYSCSSFDFVGRYAAGGIARVFPDLKSHNSVFVRFYLATFDDWQGQAITFTADGEEVFTKVTSPGAERSNQCAGDAADNIEQLFFQFAHTAKTLDLKINSNLAGSVDSASWGLCNLELYFNLCPIDKWYNGKTCAESCFNNQTEVPEMRYCETIPSEEEESVEAPVEEVPEVVVEEETPEIVVEQEEEVPEVVVIEETPEIVVEQEEEVPEVIIEEEVPEIVVEQEEEAPEVIVQEEEIPEVPVEQEEEAPEVQEEETPEVPVEQEEEAPEVQEEEEETPEAVPEVEEAPEVKPVEPVLPVEEETAETIPVTPVVPTPVVPDNGAVVVPGEPIIVVPNNTVVPTPGTVVVEPCTTSQPQVVVVDAAYNYTYHVPSFKAKAGIVISTGTKNATQTVVKSPVLSYGLNFQHPNNKNLRRQA